MKGKNVRESRAVIYSSVDSIFLLLCSLEQVASSSPRCHTDNVGPHSDGIGTYSITHSLQGEGFCLIQILAAELLR